MTEPIDCKSQLGITIGLIDAMISIARVLAPRLHTSDPDIDHALLDLAGDEDIATILTAAYSLSAKERKR